MKAATVVALSVSLCSLVQAPSTPSEKIALKLHVALEPATIPLDGYEGAVLTVGIENQGAAPIYVKRLSCFETWTWVVEDAGGVRREVRAARADAPTERGHEALDLLPPGMIASSTGGLIRGRSLVANPGKYRLHVSCSSPVERNEHDGIRVWSKNDGPLGTVFEFEVVPGRGDYEELESLEREIARAWVESDRGLLNALLTDDWILVDITGEMRTKSDVLRERLGPDAPPIEHVTVDEIRVRNLGDAAVVTGLARWFDFDDTPLTVRFTDVAVRRDGRWRIAWSQITRVTE